jgi:hypothetical protein
MVRLSLRIAFAIVALVAIVFYSITNYSTWLCTVYCNVLALALIVAAIGIAAFHGAKRAFSAGFVTAATLGTLSAFGTPHSQRARQATFFDDILHTEQLADWVYEHVHGWETPRYLLPWSTRARILREGERAVWNGVDAYVTKDGRRYFTHEVFQTTVDCIIAVLLGLAVGMVTAIVWSATEQRHRRRTTWRRLVCSE